VLVKAQELLFGKKLFFDWQLGENWAQVSMDNLEKELEMLAKNDNNDDAAIAPEKKPYVYKRQIVWFNLLGFLVIHLGAVYGLYLFLTSSMVLTMLWSKCALFKLYMKFNNLISNNNE
jgi:hypothetical protein